MWKDLNIRDRYAIIKAGVSNGITSLNTIKEKYNKFDGGGESMQLKPGYSYTYNSQHSPEEASVDVTMPQLVVTPDVVYRDSDNEEANSIQQRLYEARQRKEKEGALLTKQREGMDEAAKYIAALYGTALAGPQLISPMIVNPLLTLESFVGSAAGSYAGSKATNMAVRAITDKDSWDDLLKGTKYEKASTYLNPGSILGGLYGGIVTPNLFNWKQYAFAAKAPYNYTLPTKKEWKEFGRILTGQKPNVDNPWWERGDVALESAETFKNRLYTSRGLTAPDDFIEHAMRARRDAWALRTGVPQKYNTFTNNPYVPSTITDEQGIAALTDLPLVGGKNFDFVNTTGANIGQLEVTAFNSQHPNLQRGVVNTNDVWDIHVASRPQQRLNVRAQRFANKLYNTVNATTEALTGLPIGANRPTKGVVDGFFTRNLQRLGDWGANQEIGTILGTPPPTMHYTIPYTREVLQDFDELGNPIFKTVFRKGWEGANLSAEELAYKQAHPLLNYEAFGGNLFFPGGEVDPMFVEGTPEYAERMKRNAEEAQSKLNTIRSKPRVLSTFTLGIKPQKGISKEASLVQTVADAKNKDIATAQALYDASKVANLERETEHNKTIGQINNAFGLINTILGFTGFTNGMRNLTPLEKSMFQISDGGSALVSHWGDTYNDGSLKLLDEESFLGISDLMGASNATPKSLDEPLDLSGKALDSYQFIDMLASPRSTFRGWLNGLYGMYSDEYSQEQRDKIEEIRKKYLKDK